MLLAGLSALMLTLSFSEPSWSLLVFVALVPLWAALERGRSAGQAAGVGFLFGIIHAVGMGYWVLFALTGHYGKSLPVAILFFAATTCLPAGVLYACLGATYSWLRRGAKPLFFCTAVVPALWMLCDYIKEIVPVAIPWGFAGYALLPFEHLVQMADLVGIYGLTGLVVLINTLVFLTGQRLKKSAVPDFGNGRGKLVHTGIPLALLVCVAGFPSAYGAWRLPAVEQDIARAKTAGHGLSVALVQGNFSLKDRWSGRGFRARINTYLKLGGVGGKHKLVLVWPETVLNSPRRMTPDFFRDIMGQIGKETLLISGGLRKTAADQVYNSAYVISGNGELKWYDKKRLLPYAESAPLGESLGNYYRSPAVFKAGNLPATVSTVSGRFGLSICFEILYPGHVRRTVMDGAAILTNLSNDAWFGDGAMPYLHLDAARFRAIENRRFMLRAANSGFSAIVDPTGRVIAASTLFEKQCVQGMAAALDERTLYSQWGDWVLYGAVAILMAALARRGLAPGKATAERK